MSRPVHHLALVVRDLGRAEQFYAGVLGFAVMRRWRDERGERAVWLKLDERSFLALERADAAERDAPAAHACSRAAGWYCVAFDIAVDEREVWRERLARAGYPVMRESAYTIYIQDPEGNLVGLSHYPHEASGGAQSA